MKSSIRLLTIVLTLGLGLGCSHPEPLTIDNAWVRASAPGQETGAAYMTLSSSEDLTLDRVDSPAAASVEIHEMSMEGDVMRMRMLDNLPLKAGEAVHLEPGGYHLMLIGLKRPLEAGTHVPFILHLQDAGGESMQLSVSAPVRGIRN